MRTAQVVELGSAPQVSTVESPSPAQPEILVEIEAAPLNPLDVSVASGSFYGGHPPLPYSPGCEAVGRTGEGSLVYLFGEGRGIRRPGFLAERVAVPRDMPVPVPAGVDSAVAAAAGIAGTAAWVSAAWKAKIGPADRVLVLGASGTVGLLAVQAARVLGARRIVACGRDVQRLERARELGAHELVVRSDNTLDDAFGGEGFTVCIDPVWGLPLAHALASAAPHARVIHVGQAAGAESPISSAAVRGKELQILGHSNFALTPHERARAYAELLDHVAGGRITIDVELHALDDVAQAWERQRSGAGMKVVITF